MPLHGIPIHAVIQEPVGAYGTKKALSESGCVCEQDFIGE